LIQLLTVNSRLRRRAACVNGRFWALRGAVIPCVALLAYAECRAFGLLHGRLFDERLRLAVQVLCLGRRGGEHGPQQRAAAMSF
jgi:hypothetical protein